MAHLFMLVVILALLPAAIQTAIALGILAWYLFLGVLALGAMIFLLYHPELLFWLIAIGGGFAAIIWIAVKIEAYWPGGLEKLGYGSASFFAGAVRIIVVIDGINRDKNISDALFMALICLAASFWAGWRTTRAKPVNTSQWLKR
jgi:hypothetical protein